MASVELRGVGKSFGNVEVLTGIDLDIADGEFLTLVGASGCGKSTLLRIIAGLETQSTGSVLIGGAPVDHLRPHERRVAMVFQSYALYPHMRVFGNIALPLVMSRLNLFERLPLLRLLSLRRRRVMPEIAREVRAVAEQLQIGALLDRRPAQLSGGQRQRVALGRAMVRRPAAFLMDEPLSNLDAKLREEARAWLRELIVRMQLSALCVTHDQGEALAMSDRILLLNGGRIEQQGTPQQMYSNPQTLFTADFMGSNNRLPGRIAEIRDGAALLEGAGWRLWGMAKPGAAGGSDGVGMIRLERIRIAEGPGDNRVEAALSTSMYLGDKWEHLFHLGDARVRAYGDAPLDGGTHWLEVPRQAFWIF